ncbi:MAG TPA: right-handed parallel beta-helix repeat-containing protein [Acidimicrobiia bacterium]|nr:right-handed parallel beta-helix repeat-containing protein [Acidimicrobiia bacterium]
MRHRWGLFAVLALGLAACVGPPVGDPSPAALGDPATDSPSEWTGETRLVPQGYPTIQAAVDAADPGDLVLIDRGVYREEVQVTTPGLIIRGIDRNEVIIDGEFQRPNGIEVFFADGVAVENLTVRNATGNGVFWTGVRGFRGSYLTALNNQDYGIYAFDSSDGLLEFSYAFGSPDAGFYIGQCDPCQSTLTDSISEWNGLGFSGTNASSDLYIVESVFRYNLSGIGPNTLDGELLPPFHGVNVVGNLVHDNGNEDAPAKALQWAAQGNGIMLSGGGDSYVSRNRVFNHPQSGIIVLPMIDANVYMSYDHHVEGNVVAGSGLADLTLGGPSASGNCFEGNEYSSTLPAALELKQPCEGLRLPALFEFGSSTAQLGRLFESGLDLRPEFDPAAMPDPQPQPNMPGGADAPVVPAVNVFAGSEPDLDSIAVPEMPPGSEVTQERGINIMGVSLASAAGVFFGLYAYILPLVLYTSWVVIAIWDLSRREDPNRGKVIGWMAVILIIPFVGVIAYYLFGRSSIPVWQRWVFLAGGMAVYALFLGLGMVVGGIV